MRFTETCLSSPAYKVSRLLPKLTFFARLAGMFAYLRNCAMKRLNLLLTITRG